MSQLRRWWGYVATLVSGTFGVWWRLLPWLLSVQLVGYTLVQLALAGAPFISATHPWIALVIVSTALLIQLTAAVICLRLIGQALGMDRLLGLSRDQTSLTGVLAITLLPFLGIYSVFGQVQRVGDQLVVYEAITRGLGATSVLDTLVPQNLTQARNLIAVIIGAYVVRRVIDLLHDRTGWPVLGYVAAFVEAFFSLVVLFSGTRMISRAWIWLQDSRLGAWVAELRDGWYHSASAIGRVLPSGVDWVWEQLVHVVWPLFVSALAEPLLWLAVAALVFGTRAVSLGEVWRVGQPKDAVAAPGRAARVGRTGARRVVLEVQEALFGDLDDKYAPALLSLRLVLRGGVVFLGAYVLCYALFSTVRTLLDNAAYQVLGPRDSVFWVKWSRLLDLVALPIGETLRLCLLAVAANLSLRVLRAHADPSSIPAAADEVSAR